MPIANLNSVDLYYETSGAGDRLVLTHGSWTDGTGWGAVAKTLSDRFEVVTWDRRGHTRSADGPAPGTRDDDAADLAALIEHLGGGPVHLAGNSYGSIVVLTLMASRPDLVASAMIHEPPALALLEGSSDPDISSEVETIAKEIGIVLGLIESGQHAAAAEHFFDNVAIGPGTWQQLPEARRASIVANAPTFLDEGRDPTSISVPVESLADSTVPLLITYGTESPAWFRAIITELESHLPAAPVREIPGAGHVPHTTHSEAWVANWLAFQEQVNQSNPVETGDEREADRFTIGAADGSSIAVWLEGAGPALVMVHGSIADHTTFESFIAVLRDHFTTFAMDRRGFGATPDTDEYTINLDFSDVAAVVDAVATRTGGPVALLGHSYGANCAMGGAALSSNVSHLILYEPSLGIPYPHGSIEGIEAALERGDRDAAIVAVLTDILEMSDDEIDAMRQGPHWPTRLAVASTVPRECRVEQEWVYQPGQFDTITAPTLMLAGSESVPIVKEATERAQAAIPNARVHILEGHGHFAHKTDPAMVMAIIEDFVAN